MESLWLQEENNLDLADRKYKKKQYIFQKDYLIFKNSYL